MWGLKRKYNELSSLLQAYQSAVNEAAIVSVTDINGKIIYVNDKFVEISKYRKEELLHQTHRIVNSGYHSSDFFKDMWQTITAGKPWRGEIKNKAKDGTYYWVDTVISPLCDKKGKIFQYLSIRNLITVQKTHEEELLRSREILLKRKQQLKDAQQVAKTGSWYLNTPGHSLEWSDETYRIFGIPPDTKMTYELFLQYVHPDDKQMLEQSWQAALKTGQYDIEHRIITKEGEKWVREKARFEFDEAAALLKALGTVQDITEKKQTENTLRLSEMLYRDLFNNSPSAVGIMDKDTMQFLEVNETAINLYGYTREEFMQLNAYDVRVDEQHDWLTEQVNQGNYAGDKSVRMHKKKNGEIIFVEPTITEIEYKNKKAYLITIHDITEKLKIEEELKQIKISREIEIMRTALESEEKSRAEIGRELHDNINQLLVASTIFLKHALIVENNDKKLISKSLDITNAAMEEIRKLSSSVVPPSLKVETLKEAISHIADNFKLSHTKITVDINTDESIMEEAFKINMYRIIQEQCNNIIKHADAEEAKISLLQTDKHLILQITDNGKGFDMQQKAKGIGLSNIIHRAEVYYGTPRIESSPGNGCTIEIAFALPLH